MAEVVIPYKPRPQQLEIHEAMAKHRFGVVVCHRRMGKALALDTPIPMADGSWSTMGEIKGGDLILGTDGGACKVLKAHDVMHDRECYDLEFSNGERIVADADHLWVTTRKKDRHNPVREYINGKLARRRNMPRPAKARTTREIAQTLRSRGESNHRITAAAPIAYAERNDLPLHPYVLGAWLGDGTSGCGAITSMDLEIIERVDGLLGANCSISRILNENTGKASTYFWVGGFTRTLGQMGIKQNKHIPEAYLSAGLMQRRELLRGLMDTDGHIDKSGFCEITQKREVLADNIVQLLYSLGMQPTKHVKIIGGNPYYRVNFFPNYNCFHLQKKAVRYVTSKRTESLISIVGAVRVASVPVRCLTVAAEDKQFLVGRKYIPTHNTTSAVATLVHSALSMKRNDGRYAYIAPYYKQAKKVTWDMFKTMAFNVPGVKFYESELKVEFPNGSQIHLIGGDNPDALRGMYLDGVVIDEVADSRPNLWGEVIRPALSDRKGWALFIGTFKGVDKLYELYQFAQDSPGWFTKVYSAEDTGIIDAEELAAARHEMTKVQFAREFLCDPMAGSEDVLVPMELAMESARRQISDAYVKGAVRVLGVDVARYGGDKSVIFPVAGLKAYDPLVFEGISNTDLAQKVIWQIQQFQPDYVRVDAGRGEGVIDIIRSHGYKVMEVAFGGAATNPLYANKRSEMMHGVLDWIERGGCIPNIPTLINEMSSPYVGSNDHGKLVVESKRMMKSRGISSTDYLDALALAVGIKLRAPESKLATQIKNVSKGLLTSKRFASGGKKTILSSMR
jgi:hypothetical protein